MNKEWANLSKNVNGRRVTTVGGRYGIDYLLRATWASNGWPSQPPQVSVYPTRYADGSGAKLDGKNNYTLTFKKGESEMPPVNPEAFWSITMYQIDIGLWFYPNKQNKPPRQAHLQRRRLADSLLPA